MSQIIRIFTAENAATVRAKHLQYQQLIIKIVMKRIRLLLLLALLMTAAGGAWAQSTTTTTETYKVTMKSGTKDAEHWTIATGSEPNVRSAKGDATEGLTGVAKGDEVRLTYSGRLKVKSVEATHDGPWDGNLSNIPASAIASDGYTVIVPDGTTLTGTLYGSTTPYKIVIPAGAKVTLAGVDIYGDDNENYKWAGINCEGDATIILADNTTNKVEGFYENWPGIYVPGDKNDPSKNKTLIIKGGRYGSGKLEAKGRGNSACIGGGKEIACGNIIIKGGNIKAEGGNFAAAIGSGNDSSCGNIIIEGGNITADGGVGIGSGRDSSCGDITISGGTIEASGEGETAAIGSGHEGTCGNILINGGIVTANGGDYSAAIGSGYFHSSCGDITISGGTVTAIGGNYAPGIGSGYVSSSCGDITITKDVTLVTATKGEDAPNSIGLGDSGYECGTVTIGCELDIYGKPKSGTGTVYYYRNDYQNGGDVYLAKSPFFYPYVDLSKLTSNYVATDGEVLKGTLNGSEQPYKVSIADGATVTLDGVTINGVNDGNCLWSGLTCAGTATIILKDGTENTVKGFNEYYPGIFVPKDKTLTIKSGTENPGTLTASSNGRGCGIGGASYIESGSIEIQGGIITATGGKFAAGIGGGHKGRWGDITISGGKVTANGGENAAGIGSGYKCISYGSISITGGTVNATGGDYGAGIGSGCGEKTEIHIDNSNCCNITISGGEVTATGGYSAAGIGTGSQYSKCRDISITTGVKIVTATLGSWAEYSIGKGKDGPIENNSCGTIRIGCTLDTNGNPNNDGTVFYDGMGYLNYGAEYLSQSPLVYQPSNP